MHERLFIKIKLIFNVEQVIQSSKIYERVQTEESRNCCLRYSFSCEDKAVFVLFWDSCCF